MKTKYLNTCYTAFLIFVFIHLNANAQWGAPYTNNWISYGKSYVKIGVTKKGLHKLSFSSLPAEFSVNDPAKLQLWHRGKQVAIISTANNELLFYGVPNDGSSDSLLYRPMSSRMNPYVSLYSDESAYFLTAGDLNGLRAEVVNGAPNNNLPFQSYHRQVAVTTFTSAYSLSTVISASRPPFLNSFFENGASKTGDTIWTGKLTNYPVKLVNRSLNEIQKPSIKMMIHGRRAGSRSIEVYAGKDDKSLRLVSSVNSSNFTASVFTFELENSDVDASGNGILSLKSVSSNPKDLYSLAYYTLSYQQDIDAGNNNSYEFRLDGTNDAWTRINVKNFPSNGKIYDIVDPDVPRIINGNSSDLLVSRKAGKPAVLLATNEITTVAAAKITAINLNQINPKDYNYIILTSENLLDGAKQYATYRSSTAGGSFKPLVIDIRDVYNQFNYGEPSPVAIRRFVDYMLSDFNKDKFLLLLGKSIAFNERIVRELPNEVPTIGFPGSDMLLVEGLAGAPKDVPAIPLGRVSALTNQHVYDYLDKVKEYEHNAISDYSWKKNILHLNGGKSTAEVTQLKNILESLKPMVETGFIGGKVTPFAKKQDMAETELVNITPEINAGVGLLTYFGHGSTTGTDLDIGYITDAARGYNNTGKYPMMYFNGCGVGNVFSGRFNPKPSASDRIALSLDWILAPKKGTVAIIANTWDTYVSSTTEYLDNLYSTLFTDANTSGLPIGKIQIEVAKKVVSNNPNYYNIANVHQALLQGDPALKMIYVANPDYAVDPDESIILYSESNTKNLETSDSIRTAIIMSNYGRFNKEEIIPVQLKYYNEDGSETVVTKSFTATPYSDTLYIKIANTQKIAKVEVKIDPLNTLKELSKTNNSAELLVDWNRAKTETIYPVEKLKDIVPPLLNVTFNDRIIQNNERVAPNPTISFNLTDDRIFQADTALIDIYIKKCGDNNCDYVRLNYSTDNLKIVQLADKSIVVNYLPNDLNSGTYSILVNTRDKSGNSSVGPYEIQFRIDAVEMNQVIVTCSPNPASSYVRFHVENFDAVSIKSLTSTVYNINGVIQEQKEMILAASGNVDWYWLPSSGSGTYIYKVQFHHADGSQNETSGRILIVR